MAPSNSNFEYNQYTCSLLFFSRPVFNTSLSPYLFCVPPPFSAHISGEEVSELTRAVMLPSCNQRKLSIPARYNQHMPNTRQWPAPTYQSGLMQGLKGSIQVSLLE